MGGADGREEHSGIGYVCPQTADVCESIQLRQKRGVTAVSVGMILCWKYSSDVRLRLAAYGC